MGVSIREKPKGSGTWWVFIRHQGRRRSKKVGSHKQAKIMAREIELALQRHDLGMFKKRENRISFYKYAEQYLEKFIKPPMRAKGTYTRYKGLLEMHISPRIGSIPLVEITRKDVRECLVSYYKVSASKSSIGLMMCVISGTLNCAVDEEIIDINPAAGVTRNLRLDPKADREEICPLTPDQVREILAIIKADYPDYWPAFFTSFRTGIRIGELCGLKWDDVNFAEQYIQIRRTAKDQTVKEKPKTSAGRRRVDMSDQLVDLLAGMHRKYKKERIRSGGTRRPFIFMKDEKLLAQNTLRRIFTRSLAKAGIDHRRLHDIRHTFASQLLSNGTPIVYVKEQLGHKSIMMTVDIYGHLIPSSNKNAVNALDDNFGNGYNDNLKTGAK